MASLLRINQKKPMEIPFDRKNLTIGRGKDCDICVTKYEGISRQQCGFTSYDDGVVTVIDFGSRNGTFINDKQIFEETRLAHGDIVRICDELQFKFQDFDSEEGKKELSAKENERKKRQEQRKTKVVVHGDNEASQAMTDLSNSMDSGKDYKSLMDEIVKSTRPKAPKVRPKKEEPVDPHKSVNTYEEFNKKNRFG